jgi:predicted GNAT superfamily acetyltransferase
MLSKTALGTAISTAQIQARRVAADAARRARITVTNVEDLGELNEVANLFNSVWGGSSYMPVNFLRALAHAGNHVSAAYSEDGMVGALVGFLGIYRKEPALHSHMLAVLPELQSQGIAYALKLHQREWALGQEITVVTWTFDPLVSRNAYLNLNKLGAEGREYLVNFYGIMEDSINSGDESDRLLAVWPLASKRVMAATQGSSQPETASASKGTTILAPGPRGEPVTTLTSADVLICTVPADIAALRRENPQQAQAWRLALRRMLGGAIATGYQATAFTKAGSYVLTRA